ncbi:hypothetical protein B0H10DRAFT_1955733 [Mycena sp. CBHHK59/15]|nr:hypothetical protein B0H10DRAFT_1955733 [Mycena sp. CBHHK59/15]
MPNMSEGGRDATASRVDLRSLEEMVVDLTVPPCKHKTSDHKTTTTATSLMGHILEVDGDTPPHVHVVAVLGDMFAWPIGARSWGCWGRLPHLRQSSKTPVMRARGDRDGDHEMMLFEDETAGAVGESPSPTPAYQPVVLTNMIRVQARLCVGPAAFASLEGACRASEPIG